MYFAGKYLLKWQVVSLGIDSGQRGLALALQNQKEIGVKFFHENALVAILFPETSVVKWWVCVLRVADSYSLWRTYFSASSTSA